MKVFVVLAHPEPASLNNSLKDITVDALQKAGHEVIVSDLYRMNWKTLADADDFLDHDKKERLFYANASKKAYKEGTQTPDIEAEQKKLLWADMVIFHFPMWWFTMPAILKGWVERVFAYGFGYGVGKHEGKYWGLRYGEGTLVGKKAMLVVTAGGREPHYKETGINGPIDDLLFPINHGILWYPGISALPPFVVYQADNLSAERFEQVERDYRQRLENLTTIEPIPYRKQNGGDYDDQQQLKAHLVKDKTGFALHNTEQTVSETV